MYKVLILHGLEPQSRQTTVDHIYCYPQSRAGVLYVYQNFRLPLSPELVNFPFDAIIMNYCFLGQRAARDFKDTKRKFSFLRQTEAVKIAIPQDDYTSNITLDNWLDDIKVDVIFTPIARHLEILYPKCASKAKMKFALTGYSSLEQALALTKHALPLSARHIDLGSRVRALSPVYGSAGMQKGILTVEFAKACEARGLTVDVSTRPQDVLLGADWFNFLGSLRHTLVVRGGASLCDPVGEIRELVNNYLSLRPDASFQEVEQHCFPHSQQYDFSAISPRIFEAATLRTGLILIEDEYLPGLTAFEHYIPLAKDFSNIASVIIQMQDSEQLQAMTERAFQFLIASGRFSYASFVDEVFDEIQGRVPVPSRVSEQQLHGLESHFARYGSGQRMTASPAPYWTSAASMAASRARSSGLFRPGESGRLERQRYTETASVAGLELAHETQFDVKLLGLLENARSAVRGNGVAQSDLDRTIEGFEDGSRDIMRELISQNAEYVIDFTNS